MKLTELDILKSMGSIILSTKPMQDFAIEKMIDMQIYEFRLICGKVLPRTEDYYLVYNIVKSDEIFADIQYQIQARHYKDNKYIVDGPLVVYYRNEKKQENYYFSVEIDDAKFVQSEIECPNILKYYLYSVDNKHIDKLIDHKMVIFSPGEKDVVDVIECQVKKYSQKKQMKNQSLSSRLCGYKVINQEEFVF